MSPEDLKRTLEEFRLRLEAIEQGGKSDLGRRGELILSGYFKIIDTQMHFNEMSMRLRNFAITLILAVLGAAAYSMQTKVHVGSYHISAIILIVALVGWVAIYVLDAFYFHKLLRGAVRFGTAVEEKFKDDPMIGGVMGMTGAITAESQTLKLPLLRRSLKVKGVYKIHLFYGLILAIILLLLGLEKKVEVGSSGTEAIQKIDVESAEGIKLKLETDRSAGQKATVGKTGPATRRHPGQ